MLISHKYIRDRIGILLAIQYLVWMPLYGSPESNLEKTLNLLSNEDRFRVQIFLDQSGFSPGKLDGRNGEFTRKAAMRWIQSRERGEKNGTNQLVEIAKSSVTNPFRKYQVSTADRGHVGRVPFSLRDKSRRNSLPYARLSECVAEKFHCDEAVLDYLNPDMNIKKLETGDKIKVPNVNPFEIEKSVRSQPKGESENRIAIVWLENILEVYNSKEALIASFPVTLGGRSSHLRNGQWSVGNFTPNPEFRWDDSILKNGVPGRKKYLLPPGPNNPVGVLWMGLNQPDGTGSHIGIHGTNHPKTVGHSHSSGCIRLTNWDVVKLAKLINVGSPVEWRK